MRATVVETGKAVELGGAIAEAVRDHHAVYNYVEEPPDEIQYQVAVVSSSGGWLACSFSALLIWRNPRRVAA